MTDRRTLSVIVIAQDEEDRIRPCLESVAPIADEIVVIDGGSRDRTVEICREFTDKVYELAFVGDGPQKQRALQRATGDWVFRIDADERMSPQLRATVDEVLRRATIEATAFRVRWATYFCGRYLTHGEWGTAHPDRLFLREGASYTNPAVHARLIPAAGTTHQLPGLLYHDAHRDFRSLLHKLADYACYDAQDKADRGERGSLLKAVLHGGWRFLQSLFVRGGILDGRRGILTAFLYGHYAFNKYAALWALSFPSLPDQDGWKPPEHE